MVIAVRQLRATVASPALLLPPPVASVTMLAALAGGLGALGSLPGFQYPGGYTGFQSTYLGLVSAAFGGVLTGLAMLEDYETGMARRLLLAPAPRWAVLAGYVLAGVVRGVATAVLVTAIATVAGVPLPSPGRGAAVVGLWILLAVATGCWSVGTAVRARSASAGPTLQLPVFLALFLGPVFAPADVQNGWLRQVSDVNPLAWVLEATRSLVAGGTSMVAQAVVGMVVLIVVLAGWAGVGARRAGVPGTT
jgi:ABC-2 type transport system permease protein